MYTILLTLSYFKSVGSQYDFIELKSILGLSQDEFGKLLDDLLDKNLIEYHNYLLQISNKGLIKLIANDFINTDIMNGVLEFENINKEDAMPLTQVYVPKDFNNKI